MFNYVIVLELSKTFLACLDKLNINDDLIEELRNTIEILTPIIAQCKRELIYILESDLHDIGMIHLFKNTNDEKHNEIIKKIEDAREKIPVLPKDIREYNEEHYNTCAATFMGEIERYALGNLVLEFTTAGLIPGYAEIKINGKKATHKELAETIEEIIDHNVELLGIDIQA